MDVLGLSEDELGQVLDVATTLPYPAASPKPGARSRLGAGRVAAGAMSNNNDADQLHGYALTRDPSALSKGPRKGGQRWKGTAQKQPGSVS